LQRGLVNLLFGGGTVRHPQGFNTSTHLLRPFSSGWPGTIPCARVPPARSIHECSTNTRNR
jgi:hypothetical protein